MNRRDEFERDLERWLEARAQVSGPGALHDDIIERARGLPQRPGWLVSLHGGTFGPPVPGVGRPSAPLLFVLVALALILTLIAVAVGAGAFRPEPIRTVVRPSLPTPAAERVARHNGAITMALPTGVISIDPATGKEGMIKTRPAEYADWSPDGSRLAFLESAHLFIFDPASGVNTPVNNDLFVDAPIAWSPDGTRIAYGAVDGIHVVVVASGEDTLIPGTDVAAGASSLSRGRPSWTPDGLAIRYSTVPGIATEFRVDGSGLPRLLLNIDSGGTVPVWSPDGTKVAYLADPPGPPGQLGDPFVLQLWIADADGGHPTKVFERPGCCVGASPIGPVWSPDGAKIALDVFELWVIDTANGHALNLGTVAAGDLSWRPAP